MDKDKTPYTPIENFSSPNTNAFAPSLTHTDQLNGANNPISTGQNSYPSINTYNIINSHSPTPLYIPTHGSSTNNAYFPNAPTLNQNASLAAEKLLAQSKEKDASYDPSAVAKNFSRLCQSYLDKSVPHSTLRWIFTLLLYIGFGVRIFTTNGWYIITYALGIYLLNLLIAFLSPKIDPAGMQGIYGDDLYFGGSPNSYYDDATYYGDNESSLPTKSDDEFRPFIRRLPEFKFWLSTTKAVIVAFFCTLFEAFNVPVFWPILVMYFFILFFITMKRQILHMIKYRYLPFTHGKTRYNSGKSAK